MQKESIIPGKVKATAYRYVVEMEISGGIPELFGKLPISSIKTPQYQRLFR